MVIIFIIAFNIGVKKEMSLSLCMQHCRECQYITLDFNACGYILCTMNLAIVLYG